MQLPNCGMFAYVCVCVVCVCVCETYVLGSSAQVCVGHIITRGAHTLVVLHFTFEVKIVHTANSRTELQIDILTTARKCINQFTTQNNNFR